MPVPAVTAEAKELGFDADRLARITEHFKAYVDDGRLPGWLIAVSRHGETPYLETYGQRDMEAGAPVELDTVFRFYSMSKPITSVAAMILFEEGKLELTDPVSKFIPSFGDTRVYLKGPATNPATVAQEQPMTIHNLLTHTSGLTYGFVYANGIDHLYRQAGFEWGTPAGMDLAGACDVWASIPLLFQPGTEWNYSVSTDVLGRVVEVVSGQSLGDFIGQRICAPLGMSDTSFWCNDEQADRFAALYMPAPGTRKAVTLPALGGRGAAPPAFLGGGGGLVGTAYDYMRFSQMILNNGVLDGVRILGSRTVDYMGQNHLPANQDLEQVGRPLFSETTFSGTGFGLGFSVVIDPVKAKNLCSRGEMAWGGAASTAFWVDRKEGITGLFLTQLLPSSTWPIRAELRKLVYAALVD
jgi:CubicO group peptidase (beta-lactamase class C family)